MYGLSQNSWDFLLKTLRRFSEIEEVWIFGSRALGCEKTGSDVDLALKGKRVSGRTVAKLKGLLEDEGPLPYFFDIVRYEKISNPNLRTHIDEKGKRIL